MKEQIRYFNCVACCVALNMRLCCIIFLASVLSLSLAGPNDTLEQLMNTLTNVRFSDQALQSPVTRVEGELPIWLSGIKT